VRRIGVDQYVLRQHSSRPVRISIELPWSVDPPNVLWRTNAVNVWRGRGHVTHASDPTRLPAFEAQPEVEYVIERQCRWLSATDGGGRQGQGGWTDLRSRAAVILECQTSHWA
jgi:hypothetical protein